MSATEFTERPLSDDETARLRLLADCVATNAWWTRLLDERCVVAGGAALFVVHASQCLANVGDVDVWVPADCGERLGVYVRELVHWLSERARAYVVRVQPSMVTVTNGLLTVQFIKTTEGSDPRALLSGFDVDYVQCALRRFASGQPTTVVISQASQRAHTTGVVRMHNRREWQFARLRGADRQRAEKMHAKKREERWKQKGFVRLYEDDAEDKMVTQEVHVCRREHRVQVEDDTIRNAAAHSSGTSYWNAFPDDAVAAVDGMCVRPASVVTEEYRDDSDDEEVDAADIRAEETTRQAQTTAPPPKEEEEAVCPAKKVRLQEVTPNPFRPASDWVAWPRLPRIRAPLDRAYYTDAYEKAQRRYDEGNCANPTKVWFGLRNLQMLRDPRIPLSQVQTSVQSDALKSGTPAEVLGVGLLLQLFGPKQERTEARIVQDLYEEIVREFFASA